MKKMTTGAKKETLTVVRCYCLNQLVGFDKTYYSRGENTPFVTQTNKMADAAEK
jgi:hypothetical protein